VTKLKLYNNPERSKEEIFPEDDFDISQENNEKKVRTPEIYEVEKIQGVKNRKGVRKYLVQ
jgi:hypothetical protein